MIWRQFLLGGMVGVLMAPSLAMASFSDVVETHENFVAVQWMEGRDVIKGYEDETFHPEWEVNRAEALKIILLASDIVVDEAVATDAIALFPDVKPDQWYYPYVQKAVELGIVSGYPDSTFRPAKTVNLAEMLKMLYLANDVTPADATRAPYEDVPMDAWFIDYAQEAKTKHFIAATSDGYLHPDWAVTRGKLIEAVYRFSYVQTFENTIFPLALNWPLYQHPNSDVAFQIPFGWQLVTGTNGELVAWYQDELYHQSGWDRTTPHSAVVSIFVDPNEGKLTTKAYFDRIRQGWGAYGDQIQQTNSDTLVLDYEGPYEFMRDMVVAMPEGVFVTVQATYGKGRLAEQLGEIIREIEASVHNQTTPPPTGPILTKEEALEMTRMNIQVDRKGQQMLDLFEDRNLIETDTIGVGTGPVDYFYSAWADVTLKYERSFDVILDIDKGQTTNF